MGRPRTRYKYEIPCAVVEIVRGLCADYERRENAIKFSSIVGDVLERYVELNRAIDRALEQIEVGQRGHLIEDVAEGRGYNASMCSVRFAKNTYYERKRKFIHDVAKELFLIP